MAGYNRVATPRAYVDLFGHWLATGWCTASDITVLDDDGGAVTFDNGSKETMFDLRPSNFAQIANTTQAFYIQLDTNMDTDALAESSFLAILNHNFASATVQFKVEISDDVAVAHGSTNYGERISTTANHTKLINAAEGATNYITPAYNGWTLITWDTQTDNTRYLRITIEDTGGVGVNFAEDVFIGSIIYGEYFDFTTPDLAVKTNVEYDGVKILQSDGGGTFSNARHFGNAPWSEVPYWTDTWAGDTDHYHFAKRFGRMSHSMNFSFMADTNLFATNQHYGNAVTNWVDNDSFHAMFAQRVLGSHMPFLFSLDGGSTTSGDYAMYRLKDSGFSATQVAHRFWSVNMDIVETW